jgi:hypothetical protein
VSLMGDALNGNSNDSVGDILSRAFDSADVMPSATAELILRANLSAVDAARGDELLAKKNASTLTAEEELQLQGYLQADLILSLLKSKARQALRQALAA